MSDYRRSGASAAGRGITLNTLRDELYSLNMRMRLAMQDHDEEAQEALKKEILRVQSQMDEMGGPLFTPGR